MDDFKPSKDCLKDKTILITGTGSGIGRAAAKTLSQFGAQLILLSKDLGKLESLYEEIKDRFENLDGLINNAGILGEKKPLEQYQYSTWKKVLNVNLDSAFLLTKTLLPLLNHSKLSSVVFTSSGVGRKGRAYWGGYAISKFATEGMMEVFADELENTSKIRVNCINPGAVRTKMREEAYPAEDPETNPLPEDIMNLYVYLMCDISKDINGQSINAQ